MSCKNWNAPDKANVDQDNNAVESLLTAVVNNTEGAKRYSLYRETCGPSALEACLEGLGIDQSFTKPLQPSDFYTMWLNDPARRYPAGWDKPKNRYLEAYPKLIAELFPRLNCEVEYLDPSKQRRVGQIREILRAPQSVAMLLLENPGHFESGLHIDDRDVVTYNEPWMGNYWNKGTTRKRTIGLASLIENLKYGLLHLYE